MLIPSFGAKDKDAVSSLVLALLQATVNSALALLDLASPLAVVVVHALLIVDLTTASGFTLVIVMIAIMPMLTLMLDSPPSKASVELPVLSASPVPSTAELLVLKPLSASSTPAAALHLLSM